MDGDDRKTDDHNNWYEARIYGVSLRTYDSLFSLAISCMAEMGANVNAFRSEDMADEVISVIEGGFTIYQYEDNTSQTDIDAGTVTVEGCVELISEPIITPMGEIRTDIKLYQTDVTANFRIN